jgi:hypothetical protein
MDTTETTETAIETNVETVSLENSQSQSSGLQLVHGTFSIERNTAGAREIVFTGSLEDGSEFAMPVRAKTENSWTLSAVRSALMKSPSVPADIYVQTPNEYTDNYRFMGVSRDSLHFDFGLDDEAITRLKVGVTTLTQATLGQDATRLEYKSAQRERSARFK